MGTSTETQTSQIPPISNNEALYLMTKDYRDSSSGRELGPHTEEELSELRRSLVAFAILNDIDVVKVSDAIQVSPKQLDEDLKRDEVLSKITEEYVQKAQEGGISGIDRKKARKIELPSMSGQEA